MDNVLAEVALTVPCSEDELLDYAARAATCGAAWDAVRYEARLWADANALLPPEATRALLAPRPEDRLTGPRNAPRDAAIRAAFRALTMLNGGYDPGTGAPPHVSRRAACRWIAARFDMLTASAVEKIVAAERCRKTR